MDKISRGRLEEMADLLREQMYGSVTADIFVALNEGKTVEEAEMSFTRITRDLADEARKRRNEIK